MPVIWEVAEPRNLGEFMPEPGYARVQQSILLTSSRDPHSPLGLRIGRGENLNRFSVT